MSVFLDPDRYQSKKLSLFESSDVAQQVYCVHSFGA